MRIVILPQIRADCHFATDTCTPLRQHPNFENSQNMDNFELIISEV